MICVSLFTFSPECKRWSNFILLSYKPAGRGLHRNGKRPLPVSDPLLDVAAKPVLKTGFSRNRCFHDLIHNSKALFL